MIVMLPGVHDDFFILSTQDCTQGGGLDELGAGAEDSQESHSIRA